MGVGVGGKSEKRNQKYLANLDRRHMKPDPLQAGALFVMLTLMPHAMIQHVVLIALICASSAIPDSRCTTSSPTTTILVIYDSRANHTFELADALARGISAGGSTVKLFKVNETDSPTYTDVSAVHGLVIGSPVYFANPTAATLHWVAESLSPGWDNRTFQDVPAAVFATGGGIHQGTESTLSSLSRGLLNFGFQIVTPNVEHNGFFGTYGASAITGTPPYFQDTAPLDAGFINAAKTFGVKFAQRVDQEWQRRCK